MSSTDRARRTLVLVCRGPECGDKRGSAAVHGRLAACLAEERARGTLHHEVRLDWQSCFGQCRRGVNVLVREMDAGEDFFFVSFKPGGRAAALYHGVVVEDVERLVRGHVAGGEVVAELRRRGREP